MNGLPSFLFFRLFSNSILLRLEKKHLALLSWKRAYCVSTIDTHFIGILHSISVPDADPKVFGHSGSEPGSQKYGS
jgi:hypothetical protein